jgi:hypothetical protein
LAGDPAIPDTPCSPLLVDGYAAQHPGGASPQATQSTAIHLVVLAAVLDHGIPVSEAIPLRVAAVEVGRASGGYPKLEPVPDQWDLTITDVATASDSGRLVSGYVTSVLERWRADHDETIERWHDASVARLHRDQ